MRFALTCLAYLAATGFCLAQPLPDVGILATHPVTSEGDHTSPARFTLTRSGSTAASLSVNLLIGGSATPGADYLPVPSPITIPAGQASREIAIFPYQDSLAEGAETIVLTVDSGTGYTVASPSSSTGTVFDTQYDAWKSLQFTPAQLADPAISGPAADPDADSTPNLGEFFAGSDPLQPDLGPVAELVEIDDQLHLTIRRNPAAWALNVQIDASDTPSGWEPLNPQPPMNVEPSDGWDVLTFPIPQPRPGDTRRFWRARISEAPAETFDYYVDAALGNDSNNGTSPATAFATITQALTAMGSEKHKSVGLSRGQRHTPPLSNVFDLSGKWGAYGSGHMPFIDCSVAVDTSDISPHPTHENVYVVEITHAVPPIYYTSSQNSNGPHVGMWWETAYTGLVGEYLAPVFGLADTAASEQFIRDNPGRVFVQKVGSNLTDVRLETSGDTLRYTFQLADSSDPRTGGRLRYACYHQTRLRFSRGAQISGLVFGRNTVKDCLAGRSVLLDPNPEAPLPIFANCAWLDPGCHAFVGPSHWSKCIAYTRTPFATGAFHNHTGVFEPQTPTIYDTYVDGFSKPVYSHGSGQPVVLQGIKGARLLFKNATTGIDLPVMEDWGEFEDVILERVGFVVAGRARIRRFSALMKSNPSGNRSGFMAGSRSGELEDGVIRHVEEDPVSTRRVISFNNSTQASSEGLGVPKLTRITAATSPIRFAENSSNQKFITAVVQDSIIGRTITAADASTNRFLNASSLSNSYIGPTKSDGTPTFATLAEYQAIVPGVSNDVIMYDATKPVTFAGDPLVNPTITGPAEILGKGMGVDPAIILDLPAKLTNVPTLQSMGLQP